MQKFAKSLVLTCAAVIPMLAGALFLEIADPSTNPEAKAQNAVLVVRTAACKSPEKTTITGVAQGMVSGVRKTVPLKVSSLSVPGTYAVTREWPQEGTWVISVAASNPDYKNYVTSVLVPFQKGSMQLAAAKHLSRQPTDADVTAMLGGQSTEVRSSLH